MNNNYFKLKIEKLINILESKKIIERIYNNSFNFYDEPKAFIFAAKLKENPNNFINRYNENLVVHGISFKSEYIALIKCLEKLMCNYLLFKYNTRKILFYKYSNLEKLNKKALDPSLFLSNNTKIKENKFGWVMGFNLIENIPYFIPAQLIYLNYLSYLRYIKNSEEPVLLKATASGAACGSCVEEALLKATYDLISTQIEEYIYLNFSKINNYIFRIKTYNNKINKILSPILKKFIRYNLELFIYYIPNNLGIHSFMTLIYDQNRIEPVITIAVYSGLNIKLTIINSIEKALLRRLKIRSEFVTQIFNFKFNKNEINKNLFWFSSRDIKKIFFLLNRPTILFNFENYDYDFKSEFKILKNKFYKNKCNFFYIDISSRIFNKTDYFFYKVIIPDFQLLKII